MDAAVPEADTLSPPPEPLGRLFLRFLAFGAMAWGGPFAQIAMIKADLVERERWVSPARFNRALAVYQALPGPEAHELCVYFGMLSRGRVGGLLAGLGFMLPGLVLMLALSWAYVRFGTGQPLVQAAFLGIQAAVAAMIVRAVHRIGEHAVTDRWLGSLALGGFAAQWFGVHFAITLGAAGVLYTLVKRGRPGAALGFAAFAVAAVVAVKLLLPGAEMEPAARAAGTPATLGGIFLSGLKAGLLSFGGAYTLIPFLRRDAVVEGGWLTDGQFLDGIALGGVLPAPLVIFGTFVGYVAAGFPGALLMTLGIFLPAFGFTLVAHDAIERLMARRQVHAFLEGVTAAVVGLIAAAGLRLVLGTVRSWQAAVILVAALAALYAVKSKGVTPALVLGAALAGLLLLRA